MPNTKSAKKRLRQNVGRRARNRAGRSALRTQLKKARTAIAAGDLQASQTEYTQLQKRLDQAAAGRLIHPNAAARLKSRISAKIKQLQANASA